MIYYAILYDTILYDTIIDIQSGETICILYISLTISSLYLDEYMFDDAYTVYVLCVMDCTNINTIFYTIDYIITQ